MRLSAAVVVLLAGPGTTLPAAQPKAAPPAPLDFTGRVEPDAAPVRARVSGVLTRVAVEAGAVVKAGDLLAEIDPRPFQAHLSGAEASVRQAEARVRLADADLARARAVGERAAVAAAEADVEAARAGLARAGLDRDAAARDLSWTKLTAPAAGRVGALAAAAGDRLDAGKVVAEVAAVGRVVVAFDVDEGSFLRLRREGLAEEKKLAVAVGLAADPGLPHAGRVSFISPAVDPKTGTVRFRATCPDPDGRLLPGAFVRVRLVPDRADR